MIDRQSRRLCLEISMIDRQSRRLCLEISMIIDRVGAYVWRYQ